MYLHFEQNNLYVHTYTSKKTMSKSNTLKSAVRIVWSLVCVSGDCLKFSYFERMFWVKSVIGTSQPTGQIWPATCFINKVLVEHTTLIYLHVVYVCFHTTQAELNSWESDCSPQSIKYLLSGLLQSRMPTPEFNPQFQPLHKLYISYNLMSFLRLIYLFCWKLFWSLWFFPNFFILIEKFGKHLYTCNRFIS